MSDECQSRLSLSARVIILSEGYTLAVSHGRPGISQQVSGVALPYTESECGHQMSETVSTTHKLFA